MSMSHTEHEILSQPDVWRATLAEVDPTAASAALRAASEVLVIGCGSTHYLAITAASLLRRADVRAWALPASELLPEAQPRIGDPARSVLLAVSRSGTTTETTRAVEHFRRMGGLTVIAITCDPGSTLALQSDIVLASPAAQEKSVAQTRSFSAMTVIASLLTGAMLDADRSFLGRLPNDAQRLLDDSRVRARALAVDAGLESFYFLGGGALFGIACEGMLKLKEMSLTSSEAYHGMEFRHGPMSMCDSTSCVVSLMMPERATLEDAVVRDLAQLGAVITTVGPGQDIPVADYPEWARAPLYLLPLQLLALERAVHKGLDPDSPRNLTAVIHLDASDKAS
jgi:glucosamine--fructose-6-phosphate aminotransferase (isomerizing)